jgi:hypothetical protein
MLLVYLAAWQSLEAVLQQLPSFVLGYIGCFLRIIAFRSQPVYF